jgi:hypothetical protein
MWVNNPARSLMSISALPAGSTSSPNDPTSTDVRVKTLQAKIQDWATCPTTDPQTKKEIVGKLQQQLDVVKASIKSEQSKKSEGTSTSTSDAMPARPNWVSASSRFVDVKV